MHSLYSDDGQYTPEELMALCKKAGLRTAAIADHNCVSGIAAGLRAAQEEQLELIPAVELDCTHDGVNFHLLGYFIEPDEREYGPVEENLLAQDRAACQKRMRLVRAAGIKFDEDFARSLSRNGVVTSEMIAEAALAVDQDRQPPLMAPYYPGGERSDNPFVNFYWDHCAQGKPFFSPVTYQSLREACALIRRTGGVPILAHPGNNLKERVPLMESVFKEDVCGMEVYSSYHTPEQTEFYRVWCEKLGGIATCGSDFHGKTKPSIRLGSADCRGSEDEVLDRLRSARK
ncbi:PHP domain-containing protein [Zongyangia hominis]|nr:PHP domain-containing protein [Zongyangia hominis]